MNLIKHVGRVKNTDSRCVVLYMQLPEDNYRSLIVESDCLPDLYRDSLMAVLESKEAQQEDTLANILHRRNFPDGNNMLQSLHQKGYIRTESIDNIVMVPVPNKIFELRQILELAGKIASTTNSQLPNSPYDTKESVSVLPQRPPLDETFNPHKHNLEADKRTEGQTIARNLLREATDLEGIAAMKRQEALRYDPSLQVALPTNLSTTASQPEKRPRGRPRKVGPLGGVL